MFQTFTILLLYLDALLKGMFTRFCSALQIQTIFQILDLEFDLMPKISDFFYSNLYSFQRWFLLEGFIILLHFLTKKSLLSEILSLLFWWFWSMPLRIRILKEPIFHSKTIVEAFENYILLGMKKALKFGSLEKNYFFYQPILSFCFREKFTSNLIDIYIFFIRLRILKFCFIESVSYFLLVIE